ncbi:MAG: hypothetical protein R3F33_08150 [Planctomycetota bacterium]
MHYPVSGFESLVSSEFQNVDFKDFSTLPPGGGDSAVDTGYHVWHGYRLPWVRTRHFHKDGDKPTYHESIRINMTRGTFPLVLYARWRPLQEASIDSLLPMLDALVPSAAE